MVVKLQNHIIVVDKIAFITKEEDDFIMFNFVGGSALKVKANYDVVCKTLFKFSEREERKPSIFEQVFGK